MKNTQQFPQLLVCAFRGQLSFLMSLAFLLLLGIGQVSAQTTYQEVVYLKNGSIIRGTIIEQVPNQSIKIETGDGSVFVFTMDEIEKMTKEAVAPPSSSNVSEVSTLSLAHPDNERKFEHYLEGGFAYDGYLTFSSFGHYLLNYRLLDRVSAGVGLGINYDSSEGVAIPIFANVKAYALNGTFSPGLSLIGGYQIGLGGYSAALLEAAVGIRVLGSSYGWTFDLGYRSQFDEGYLVAKAGYVF